MGCRNRELLEEERAAASASLSDALLLTTMCIVGLQVEVHVKDGSVYSGIFHTACVESDYGIILKKARMIKKGKCDANVTNGDLVETLVVLSEDLVQVVAKGILLPVDGVSGNVAVKDVGADVPPLHHTDVVANTRKQCKSVGDIEPISQTRSAAHTENGYAHGCTPTTAHHVGDRPVVENGKSNGLHTKKIQSEIASCAAVNMREVEDSRSKGKQGNCRNKTEFRKEESMQEAQGPGLKLEACTIKSNPVGEHVKITSKPLSSSAPCDCPAPSTQIQEPRTSADVPCSDAKSSLASSYVSPVLDANSESYPRSLSPPSETVLSRSSGPSRTAKEFKLNPGAKIFCPSSANLRSTTPPAVPTVATMNYIPDNCPIVPITVSQPEVELSAFAPRSSVPVKFVHYGNMITGHGDSNSQYSQPIVGHVGSRTQPVRYGGQYPSVQAGPVYVHPNPQNVMVGRLGGQLVYVHPVSHDVTQSVAALSQVAARPLLTPHQVHLPKHQGGAAAQALQLCVSQPFMPGGQQQSYAMPSHIPLAQSPFPVMRPISVPGSNGFYSAKFP